jgi:hypothetical protein
MSTARTTAASASRTYQPVDFWWAMNSEAVQLMVPSDAPVSAGEFGPAGSGGSGAGTGAAAGGVGLGVAGGATGAGGVWRGAAGGVELATAEDGEGAAGDTPAGGATGDEATGWMGEFGEIVAPGLRGWGWSATGWIVFSAISVIVPQIRWRDKGGGMGFEYSLPFMTKLNYQRAHATK